jgi:hypothetical protein
MNANTSCPFVGWVFYQKAGAMDEKIKKAADTWRANRLSGIAAGPESIAAALVLAEEWLKEHPDGCDRCDGKGAVYIVGFPYLCPKCKGKR